jgi:cyclomaltodextrinase / maltogenic alpha-amylase / neopullulanase
MSKWIVLATALFMTHSDVSAQRPFTLSLDGEWLFRVDSMKVGITDRWYADSTDRTVWQHVPIPRYWEEYPGLAQYDGWGWFARSVRLPRSSAPLSVHFAGVDDEAVVWINGIEVGSHSGYSDPFTVDITGVVHEGENSIVVLVKDNGGGGGIYRSITLLETSALENFLKGPYSGMPALRSADWVREAVIYSVYLRSFSPEGTFAGLERRIPELKNLGVTVLWLLPIHPVGEKARKGPLGSPYSVQDYYGINSEFGTMADFKRLLAAAHKSGLKLIIDLVANHTSWDSRLIKEHPEWFSRDGKGAIKPPNPDWTDVAQLDYSRPGLRQYMTDMMVWWVRDIGIDGFRCDVAELVPTSFWDEARLRLNRIKPVMMLSEGSIPEHHVRAFDITYSWNIYDVLGPLLSGKRPVALLDQILKNEELQFPVGSLRLRFTTNHDKNAWDSPALLKFGEDGLRLATVLVNTIPGVPLIYTGEEIPNDKRLSLFEKVNVNWSQQQKMQSLYHTLFQLRKEHKALSRGQMVRVTSPDSVYAFVRVAGTDRVLSVLNFGTAARAGSLQIPTERIVPGKTQVIVEDVFTRARTTVSSDSLKQLHVELPPRGYAVFVIR